jgi:hypothetical protein
MAKRLYVTNAAFKLPQNIRSSFLRAWKQTGCMDLGSGDVGYYMAVIAQQFESNNQKLKTATEKLDSIRTLATPNTI